MKVAVCGVVCWLALAPVAPAREPDPYADFDRVTLERASPHVAWGKPLAGGTIDVLFIAPRFTLRDAAELAQRLDLKYDVAPVWDAHHLGGEGSDPPGGSREETVARLRDRLADSHDVIVMGNLALSILPEDVLEEVVAQVASGTGLVLAHYGASVPPGFQGFLDALSPSDGADAITRGIGEGLTPEWPLSLDFVKARRHEQGRVVLLDYVGEPPATHFLTPSLSAPLRARWEFFDTYLSLVAKAVRWAAGRDPGIWVAGVEEAGTAGPPENEIPPGLPENYVQRMHDAVARPLYHPFVVRFNEAAARRYRIRAQVRGPRRGSRTEWLDLPRLRKGEDTYVLELPIGPGRYFLDLWVVEGKGVVEWHTKPITVHQWPEFSDADVSYSKGYLLPNDTLTISVQVRPNYDRPRPCTLYARGVDSFGRLVAEGSEPVASNGGRAQVGLEFADLIANLVKVEVFLADKASPHLTRWDRARAAHTRLFLPVRRPWSRNAFHVAFEGRALAEYNVRTFTGVLAEMGVDAVYAPATDDARFYLAQAGLQPIPELVRLGHAPGIAGMESEAERLRDLTTAFGTVGATVYMLREGSSANAVGDAVPGAAAEPAGVGSWLESQLDEDGELVQALVRGRDLVREVDADALVGFRALRESGRGHDWWGLASTLEAMAVPLDPVTVEQVRSYRRPGSYAALVFDPAIADEGALARAGWLPWRQALHGFQGGWLAAPFGKAQEASLTALTPDGRPTRALAALAEAAGELKSGIGTLLVRAERKPPPIAVYDSRASRLLAQHLSGKGHSADGATLGFIRLLERLGYQYDFVSSAQAAAGGLDAYGLVVLPGTCALSEAEVEALRAFHARGGGLIADAAPGRFDGHAVAREAFPLDDVFGIRHQGPPESGAPTDATVQVSRDETVVSGVLRGVSADVSVEVTAGGIGGTTQDALLWMVQGEGAGLTALLNHTLPPYPSGDAAQDAALADLFGALLGRAQVARAAPFSVAKGGVLEGECVALRYGQADVIAFLRDPDADAKKQQVTLRLEGHDWVYDLRRAVPVGNPKKVRVDLERGGVAVFAALPYEVVELALVAPGEVAPGRRLPLAFTVKTKGGLPGTHLLHLGFARSGGQAMPHYTQDVVCVNGAGKTYIPLARDEQAGLYDIEVRDVLSGVSAQARVRVGP